MHGVCECDDLRGPFTFKYFSETRHKRRRCKEGKKINETQGRYRKQEGEKEGHETARANLLNKKPTVGPVAVVLPFPPSTVWQIAVKLALRRPASLASQDRKKGGALLHTTHP